MDDGKLHRLMIIPWDGKSSPFFGRKIQVVKDDNLPRLMVITSG